uniref:Translation initiation factor IF-1, chloroplastic n=1 Tax=Craspedostauros australis TaxID=1486917 RepID=A0A7R9WWC5_9STRA|mmetsp:Transcript_23958/g.66977  ORF Transcript_23958/g.66977 Transcript_23958/m.66977 type:complete len:147 (+) Transcript_23958:236-676(+)|eukprot:CAMPEP_0198122966 /NCGR_PEP_ID=MMETSP1442-20131203/36341_1 /TAXON_ID= /ORGANISM="Craspedostauros australis, Strain CCMP3328" /LENGTH=146 /DNA_ID=CAMNT_0043782089 /DNA_START=167 /DNA_END=607 /DNA_ORIENTATION=+
MNRLTLISLMCALLVSLSSAFTVMPSTRTAAGVSAATAAAPSTTALFGKKAARAQGNARKGAATNANRVRKPKDDVIEIDAVVIDSLPNAMFRCQMEGAPETQPPILATISGKIRKNYVKILVGDRVLIELSPYDLTRGRITFRYR